LLLVLAYPGQARVVGDVRDRAVHPGLSVLAGRLLPAVGPHAQLLTEQGGEDLRLLLAEARQRRQPLEQLWTGGGATPYGGRVAVVLIHEELAQLLGPSGHGPGEAVQRGRSGEDLRERLRVVGGEPGRVQAGRTQALGQPVRGP